MPPRNVPLLLLVAAFAAGCVSFKEGGATVEDGGSDPDGSLGHPDGGASDADTGNPDAYSGRDGGPTGPGALGALPSGYCCTSNDQCRYRQCIQFGSTKMCADECIADDVCKEGALESRCVGASGGNSGRCEPASAVAKCIPADRYPLGTKRLGTCCDPKTGQKNGLECAGGHCISWHTGNPFICDNVCETITDCPGGTYDCLDTGDGYSLCAPIATTYTCQPQ